MLDEVEFPIGSEVSYWNGQCFQRAWVYGLYLDPVKEMVKYRVTYGGGEAKGKFRNVITPFAIRQSKHFDKDKA